MIVTIDLRIIHSHPLGEHYRHARLIDAIDFARCDYLLEHIHFEDSTCYEIEYRGARIGIKWTLWEYLREVGFGV